MAEYDPILSFVSEFSNETYDNSNETDYEIDQILAIPVSVEKTICIVIFTLCCLGLLGNGKVIWILGFHMKKNSFSIYVLNLAVADSGVLLMEVLTQTFKIYSPLNFKAYKVSNLLYFVLYNTSQLLLISISVDRCVAVLFPIWHQCHRPPKLSLTVCIITWISPLVYFVLEMVVITPGPFLLFQLVFNGLISYPVMVISSLILLIKFFFKQRQQKRKKVLSVTLVALMCFVVFRLPLSIFSIITYSIVKEYDLTLFLDDELYNSEGNSPIERKILADFFLEMIYFLDPWSRHVMILALVSDICIIINSSINPIIYFLAGRNKGERSRVTMKLALHRVFTNEEDTKEDEMQPNDTQL